MRVEKCIVIQRPVEEVYAFVTDMRNVTRWTPATEIRQVDKGPLCVGKRYVQAGEFFNRRMELTTEVTEYQPPSVFAFKAIAGPVPLSTKMLFTSIPQGTQVTMIGEGEPGPLFKLAGPLLTLVLRKQIDTQLDVLKRLLEEKE
ncbi:polyketide cyclase/dehydrase/lipid transport protein [Thermosporothrix hazakensis]|jgi:uncharacterized protein YndB with AHSA1/START domain|uniref:Polyketide cyclase/dehydrase/lipid transport protein n=2 Tax=Thermosporothrix TaxID=768650 RepID=A0A326UBL5_THEHA|nr:SRPBCC family protein [Thermosporothrix hazakensis]PZW25401.1 polyketide cyclase/dehydrase/lipid transport protein [Thermosporothrix hazakensis]BBH90735.1 hypothetical protein KTC_54860 [Thermosporothrix sp. COM3]GCE48785.1 hypothetical protein KTH_36540 [Thermosporothrix hazakensis]